MPMSHSRKAAPTGPSPRPTSASQDRVSGGVTQCSNARLQTNASADVARHGDRDAFARHLPPAGARRPSSSTTPARRRTPARSRGRWPCHAPRGTELVPHQHGGGRQPEQGADDVCRRAADARQQAREQHREQRPQRGDQVRFRRWRELQGREVERVVAEQAVDAEREGGRASAADSAARPRSSAVRHHGAADGKDDGGRLEGRDRARRRPSGSPASPTAGWRRCRAALQTSTTALQLSPNPHATLRAPRQSP